MPAGVTAVAWSQANGRAEQRTINVEDARRCGVEVILDHPAAQWAVRHAEWIQNFIVKSDVGLSGSGTIKITLREAHTGDKSTEQCCWILGPSSCSQWHLLTQPLTSSLSWKTEVCGITVRRNTVLRDAVQQPIMKFRVRSQR